MIDLSQYSFSHYSDQIIERPTLQPLTEDMKFFKPQGFWISVDGEFDWLQWCVAEQFHLENLRYRHVIKLKPGSNILVLRDEEEVFKFSEAFKAAWEGFERIKIGIIDWYRVRQHYDGIIIPQYLWELRLNQTVHWYYSWDCSSGCIWNPNVIESVTLDNKWKQPKLK